MASDDQAPEDVLQRGFEGEIRRHYTTRSDVQEMLEPLSDAVSTHRGYHEGTKITWTLMVPLICVLVTATAIIISAFVG